MKVINRIVYKLSVHPEDMGKVIGKQGRVAKAIRTIVYSAAGSHHEEKNICRHFRLMYKKGEQIVPSFFDLRK